MHLDPENIALEIFSRNYGFFPVCACWFAIKHDLDSGFIKKFDTYVHFNASSKSKFSFHTLYF